MPWHVEFSSHLRTNLAHASSVFCWRVCQVFMNMVVADGVERSGRQGVHAQTVARCAYDEGPEPQIQKLYKWLATWPGTKGLHARCKCQQDHRTVGHTSSQGGWSGNLPFLAESASYPKKLGKALPTACRPFGSSALGPHHMRTGQRSGHVRVDALTSQHHRQRPYS